MSRKSIYKKKKYLYLEYDPKLFNKWSIQPNRQENDMDPSIHHKIHTNDSYLKYQIAKKAGELFYFKEFDPYEFDKFELDEFKFDFEK